MNHFITIGIGNIVDSIDDLVISYSNASLALSHKYFFGKDNIISYKDIDSRNSKDISLPKINTTILNDYLRYGEENALDEFLTDYLKPLSAISNQKTYILKFIFLETLIISKTFIEDFSDELNGIIDDDFEKYLISITTLEKLYDQLKRIIKNAILLRNKNKNGKYINTIQKAKDYIERFFDDEDISLNKVASHVNLSSGHFSTIFSQATDSTFIEYLTNIRIRKAKELLKSTSMQSAEISYQVGYNDPQYFCYVFKKLTGVSPLKYRGLD